MKEKYTAVIIDDEAKARRILATLLLDDFEEISVVDSAEDVLSGIKAINKHNPDIIFLDIEMPVIYILFNLKIMDGYECCINIY